MPPQNNIRPIKAHGITKTWYYACPALVLLGSRSCLSISGKVYEPSDEKVGSENLVTIDLSPLSNKIWGDCSRSFVVESGKVKSEGEIKNQEFVEGLKVERELHSHSNLTMRGFLRNNILCEIILKQPA